MVPLFEDQVSWLGRNPFSGFIHERLSKEDNEWGVEMCGDMTGRRMDAAPAQESSLVNW